MLYAGITVEILIGAVSTRGRQFHLQSLVTNEYSANIHVNHDNNM